jgi:hypothetical protein
MTNRRPQQSTEKALRQSHGANLASAESLDVCELLVAELQSRRVRLQKLLQLVRMEMERLPARRAPLRPHARCSNVRIKHVA